MPRETDVTITYDTYIHTYFIIGWAFPNGYTVKHNKGTGKANQFAVDLSS